MNTHTPTKFVIINGSPKKDGHTSGLAKAFAEAARKYGSCEEIFLHDDPPVPVTGELDVPLTSPTALQKKLLECDAFVVVTPTYWFNLPGIVKNFIDQLTILEDNGFLLEGKVAGAIVYTPEGGGVNVLQNLAMVYTHMGMTVPPYSLIFDRGNDLQWVKEDIPLLAHGLHQQVMAQKKMNFSWDLSA